MNILAVLGIIVGTVLATLVVLLWIYGAAMMEDEASDR